MAKDSLPKGIAEKLKTLPMEPGVYLMKDGEGRIIYVGKAVLLRNRVRSYFRKLPDEAVKTKRLVANIADFDYILTDNEAEALLLEDTLIKKHRPKYNISLKDDKTYPYVRVTADPAPAVFVTRTKVRDGSRYFGPYIHMSDLRESLDILRKVYRFRSCSPSRFRQGESCLNAHIDLCQAPCVGGISLEDYQANIEGLVRFLSGYQDDVLVTLRKEMEEAAENLHFEEAAEIRDRLLALAKISDRQKAVSNRDQDQDMVALARDSYGAAIQVFFIRGGRILGRENFLLKTDPEDASETILQSFLKQFYLKQTFVPGKIYVDRAFPDQAPLEDLLSTKHGHKVSFHIPQIGTQLALLNLVRRNAQEALAKRKIATETRKERTVGALEELAAHLNLDRPPQRIECFDISHIQGSDTVASMVVFKKGQADSSAYRRFRVKTVEGVNDFASMEEVVGRRFARAKAQSKGFEILPDLVLIDGGKGQLAYARRAMTQAGYGHIPTFALAEETDTLFSEDQPQGIYLPAHANSLYLLQRIRDESHRFAITYHRSLRGKRQLASVLDDIPGIGPKRKSALLTHFGSFSKIQDADIVSLSQVPGISQDLAETIFTYLKSHQDLQARTTQRTRPKDS